MAGKAIARKQATAHRRYIPSFQRACANGRAATSAACDPVSRVAPAPGAEIRRLPPSSRMWFTKTRHERRIAVAVHYIRSREDIQATVHTMPTGQWNS
jgi:hypothetical protein